MPRIPTGLIVLSLVITLLPRVSTAEPPANADPALQPWFESLRQPGTGVSCCSVSDCRPVQYRLVNNGYEALIGSLWVLIPENRVLHHQSNPLGRAVLCRSPASGAIYCFVPGPET